MSLVDSCCTFRAVVNVLSCGVNTKGMNFFGRLSRNDVVPELRRAHSSFNLLFIMTKIYRHNNNGYVLFYSEQQSNRQILEGN